MRDLAGLSPFVGRGRELALLVERLGAATIGRGGVVLIGGEPGIGKTRLLEELAVAARDRDTAVVWGRCYEGDGAPAFWLWTQIVRALARDRDPAEFAAALGPGAADIAELAPEVRAALPNLPTPPALEPAQARFRLFDSVSSFLRRAAAPRPLMLLLDDLHWADRPSLLLLEFLARDSGDMRLLVAGAYRDIEPDDDLPLTATLAALRRGPAHHRISLHGLSPDETGLLAQLLGVDSPDTDGTFAQMLHQRTEGNPFFVQETLRHLVEAGWHAEPAGRPRGGPDPAAAGVPEGVREIIGRRLTRLSPACRRLLDAAAVLGRDVDVEVLVRVAPADAGPTTVASVLDLLAEAERARLIQPAAGTPGRYRFVHALIRETLYGSLDSAQRVRLHHGAGEALEYVYHADPTPRLAELAYHFFEAVPVGNAGTALEYALGAAQQARALFAFEGAVVQFERALLLATPDRGVDGARRCDVLLALGECWFSAGDMRRVRDLALEATVLARRAGGTEQLARAVLLFGQTRVRYFTYDHALLDLIDEALIALGPADSAWCVRLLARRAVALATVADEQDESVQAGQAALAIARRLNDPATLVLALMAHHTSLWGPENATERLAITTEAAELAGRFSIMDVEANNPDIWRCIALLELGEIEAADRSLAAVTRLVDASRSPLARAHLQMARAARALLAGDFEAGIQRATASYEQMERLGMRAYAGQPRVTLFFLHREQGRLAEDEPFIRGLAEAMPMWLVLQCMAAALQLDLGRIDDARDRFERLASAGFSDLPRTFGQGYQVAVPLLAELCAAWGDRARAAVLYDLLLPLAGHLALYSDIACIGAADRYLGLLATTLGRWPEAATHFEHALTLNARVGGRPWLAHTQHEYAVMLLHRHRTDCSSRVPAGRGRPADCGCLRRTRELLDAALAAARAMGMRPLVARTEEALAVLNAADVRPQSEIREPASPSGRPRADLPDGLTGREVEVLRLLAAGRTNRQIAEDLVLSVRTVERHITHIYGKTGVSGRADAALYAARHDLLLPPAD